MTYPIKLRGVSKHVHYYLMQWAAEGSIFGAVSLVFCMKYLRNRWTDLRQIHKKGVFRPSLGRVWRSRSKVKGHGQQGQKRHFSALSAACVPFIFGKTYLASSLLLLLLLLLKLI